MDSALTAMMLRAGRTLILQRLQAEPPRTLLRLRLSAASDANVSFASLSDVLAPPMSIIPSDLLEIAGAEPTKALCFSRDGSGNRDVRLHSSVKSASSSFWTIQDDSARNMANTTAGIALNRFVWFQLLHNRVTTPAFYAPHADTTTIPHVIDRNTMTLRIHEPLLYDRSQKNWLVSLESGGAKDRSCHLFSTSAFDLEEMQSLCKYDQEPTLGYFMEPPSTASPTTAALIPSLISQMVNARATQDGTPFVVHPRTPRHDDVLQTLDELGAAGMVRCVGRDDTHSSWWLTTLGETSVVQCIATKPGATPTQLLKVRDRADTPLRDLHMYELFALLVENKWVHEVRPGRRKLHLHDGLPEFYQTGNYRRFFSVVPKSGKAESNTVSRYYLLALLCCHELPAGTKVPHCGRDADYLELIKTHLCIETKPPKLKFSRGGAIRRMRKRATQPLRKAKTKPPAKKKTKSCGWRSGGRPS